MAKNSETMLFETSKGYEKCKKRRLTLKKNIQKLTMGKPFTVLLYSGDEVRRNGDVLYPFRCDSNFYYLTGFNEPNAWMIMYYDGKRRCEEIIVSKKKNKLKELWDGKIIGQREALTNFLFDSAYPNEDIDRVVISKFEISQCIFFPISDKGFSRKVTDWLSRLTGKKRLGVDSPDYMGDLNHLIENQRVIKDADELKTMKRAARISAEAHKRAMKIVQPGIKEFDVETELLSVFRKNG